MSTRENEGQEPEFSLLSAGRLLQRYGLEVDDSDDSGLPMLFSHMQKEEDLFPHLWSENKNTFCRSLLLGQNKIMAM